MREKRIWTFIFPENLSTVCAFDRSNAYSECIRKKKNTIRVHTRITIEKCGGRDNFMFTRSPRTFGRPHGRRDGFLRTRRGRQALHSWIIYSWTRGRHPGKFPRRFFRKTLLGTALTEIGGDLFAAKHEREQQHAHQPRPRVTLVHRRRPHVHTPCPPCQMQYISADNDVRWVVRPRNLRAKKKKTTRTQTIRRVDVKTTIKNY